MDLTDIMIMYKKTRIKDQKHNIISKIGRDYLLAKEAVESMREVLDFFDSNYYATLLEAISKVTSSVDVVSSYLPDIISEIPLDEFERLIIVLKRYYPSINLDQYKDLFDKRLKQLCIESKQLCDYDLEESCLDIQKVYETGIFENSFEYYFLNYLVVQKLIKHFFVSFVGKNKEMIDVIHAFVTSLQLEAREQGLSDQICYVGEGGFSLVLKIGNKLLKLGRSRYNNKIPYHPKIIQWEFRRYFEESGLLIEVQKMHDNKDIPSIAVDRIFIELYEGGLAWMDNREDNVVRLTLDNDYPYDKDISKIGKDYLGINSPIDTKYICKESDYVICDTDFISPLCSLSRDKRREADLEYKIAKDSIQKWEELAKVLKR